MADEITIDREPTLQSIDDLYSDSDVDLVPDDTVPVDTRSVVSTVPGAALKPHKRGFVAFVTKLAVKFNRTFQASVRKNQNLMAEFARTAHNIGADLKAVRTAHDAVLDGTQFAVLARHHRRIWESERRKNTIQSLKHGCDAVDAALDRIGKIRRITDECEAFLRDSRGRMSEMVDTYAELEKRFASHASQK